MTSNPNSATIGSTGAIRDRVRVRPLLAALALALAVAIGAAVAIDVTTEQPVRLAPSYQGDWKDTFLGGGAATGYQGDWKDTFLPEVAGR